MHKYLMFVVLCVTPLVNAAAAIVEGQDYQVIQGNDQTTHKGAPVRITEFFSYGCPWCYRLESAVVQWKTKQGNAIQFRKVPVVFNKGWEDYARAYYTIDALSLDKSVHEALFKAIIVDKQPLDSPQAMIEFFKKNGVEPSMAESAFSNSPSIELRLKADAALMGQFQINAVPTLVIDNHYKTNLQMAKTEAHLFEVLDYLVEKVKKDA